MHGKKRAEYKARFQDPKTVAVLESKAEQWHALMKELQHRRNLPTASSNDNVETTMKLLEKALLVNPDPLNLWNHRREVLLLLIDCDGTAEEDDEIGIASNAITPVAAKILETERALTQAAIQRNPKAYGAWLHRKWIVQKIHPSTPVLQEELALTAMFLNLDERNFHCWNYRRFVVACLAGSWDGEWKVSKPGSSEISSLMGPQIMSLSDDKSGETIIPHNLLKSEFDFTTAKIKDNFSNFSAFHYRSQLLDFVLTLDGSVNSESLVVVQETQLLKEFQLLEDAICTEPDDQTAWWYHAILLNKLEESDNHKSLFLALQPRLEEQASLFRELMEDSPGKWIMLGLYLLLQVLRSESPDDIGNSFRHEQESLLKRLMEIDPDRSQRYQSLLSQNF